MRRRTALLILVTAAVLAAGCVPPRPSGPRLPTITVTPSDDLHETQAVTVTEPFVFVISGDPFTVPTVYQCLSPFPATTVPAQPAPVEELDRRIGDNCDEVGQFSVGGGTSLTVTLHREFTTRSGFDVDCNLDGGCVAIAAGVITGEHGGVASTPVSFAVRSRSPTRRRSP